MRGDLLVKYLDTEVELKGHSKKSSKSKKEDQFGDPQLIKSVQVKRNPVQYMLEYEHKRKVRLE